MVKAFVGVHPSDAPSAGGLDWYEGLLRRATGAGEIGLDPKYSPVGAGSAQLAAFERQLAIAEDLGKPVQVHSRGAEAECLGVLSKYGLKRVLMHWFEREDLVSTLVERRYFVSIGPAILYSKKLRRVAGALERELVLTESDGPVAFRALEGPGGPQMIPSVVFALSEVWGSGFEEAARQVESNTNNFLFPKKA